jgi:hypothetical protein
MIYGRVSHDPFILDEVKEMVAQRNPMLSGYDPSVAVIITWHNNVPVKLGPNV